MKNIIGPNIIKYAFIVILFTLIISPYSVADAYTTEMIFNGGNQGDIALKGGKISLELDPGQSVTKEITFTNRLGKESAFLVEIEDIAGSRDINVNNSYTLQGIKKGPYSLKDYIHPELMEFTLKDGEQIHLPVTINIPADSRPGGLYGAIAFSSKDVTQEKIIDNEKVAIVPRVAYIYMIKVKGPVNEDGSLKELSTTKKYYEKGPVIINYIVENNGNIHLSPYGEITIKNIIGREIEKIKIDPFFTIPDSLRKNSISFNRKFMFGRYAVSINLNRGYLEKDDVVDTKTIYFWVIPWKLLAVSIIGIVIIIWLLSTLLGRFKLVKD